MKTVKTYIVYCYTDKEQLNTQSYYIQALSATQAVEILGIREEDVIEVAVVLQNWKRSK